MNSLTRNDLFVDASLLDFNSLLLEWPGLVLGEIRPIGASVFGDLFFERRSGEVTKLDVLKGGMHLIAISFQQFAEVMNSPEWQEEHLLSQSVALLKEKGVSRAPSQFFGFAPHPSFTGKTDWSRVKSLDAVVWHSICAQMLDVTPLLKGAAMPEITPKRPWWKLGKG
ncbi:DUF1851 domain-containing protein [Janthinobacterium sp. PAMC25594]|uniref:DUF1851 domain-containing protein n=1 Tax=Janthinobacterium sp. PAMC25594 TaxID=2861284 RepID=UPI001C637593|nr:DUF1851 domain-containing protein [Janthinobacterium sp. PAMC25594]QYG08913.1 DUF1851 domain-containing protein [Janthinobacterium sp. PAMC25594]